MTKRTVKRKPSQKPKRSVDFSLVDRGAGRVPQGFGIFVTSPSEKGIQTEMCLELRLVPMPVQSYGSLVNYTTAT